MEYEVRKIIYDRMEELLKQILDYKFSESDDERRKFVSMFSSLKLDIFLNKIGEEK